MPPRIPNTLADAVVRSASRPRSGRQMPRAVDLSTRPSSAFLTVGSTRAFTCSSCQLQQQRQKPPSSSTAYNPASADAYAAELQSSTPPSETNPVPQRRLPRWSSTPAGLARAPFSVRKNDPANRFPVNEDPALLDRAWEAVFGEGGANLVPAEVRWLAVTHKSFDQGRRGFNDRLCFLGKRIVDLQTSLAILAQGGVPEAKAATNVSAEAEAEAEADADAEDVSSALPSTEVPAEGQQQVDAMTKSQKKKMKKNIETDDFGRELFDHPVGRILPRLTSDVRADHTEQRRLALLARDFGLHSVVRWKPRAAADLQGSGFDVVVVQALYAMVGALALHRGGDVAVQAVRARLLPRLGLKV